MKSLNINRSGVVLRIPGMLAVKHHALPMYELIAHFELHTAHEDEVIQIRTELLRQHPHSKFLKAFVGNLRKKLSNQFAVDHPLIGRLNLEERKEAPTTTTTTTTTTTGTTSNMTHTTTTSRFTKGAVAVGGASAIKLTIGGFVGLGLGLVRM